MIQAIPTFISSVNDRSAAYGIMIYHRFCIRLNNKQIRLNVGKGNGYT